MIFTGDRDAQNLLHSIYLAQPYITHDDPDRDRKLTGVHVLWNAYKHLQRGQDFTKIPRWHSIPE